MSTVKDLKKLAKERGLRGYSKLRKAELLSLLYPIPILKPPPKSNISTPAPRLKKYFSEKPTPAPRLKKDFSEKPTPAPRNPSINVPVLQQEIVSVRQMKPHL